MLKLYDATLSGNCYKVRLMLSLLNLQYELIPVNLREGEQKSPEYLKLNLFGQVPVLIDDRNIIRDSQAILVYLARRYGGEWFPLEAGAMALVMQWLSTAAHDIQQGLAAARVYHLLGRQLDIEMATQRAYAVLNVIDRHLTYKQWLELERPTIADVACFPYIASAGEGKIALEKYSNVVAWSDRIKKLPNFLTIPSF
jgi:glutathione S-transferase